MAKSVSQTYQQPPCVEKTPEARLPAPTIPGEAETLIVTKVPLAPRALRFIDISPDNEPSKKGVPMSARLPRTPYHLRSWRYITEVTQNPTWTMKCPRSNIVMMVDPKRHRTSEATSVDQPPDYKTEKGAPKTKQAVGEKEVAGTSIEGQDQTMCSTPSAKIRSNKKKQSDSAVVIAYKRRQRTPRTISGAADQQAIQNATTGGASMDTVPASTLAVNQPLWDLSPATFVQKSTYGIDLLSQVAGGTGDITNVEVTPTHTLLRGEAIRDDVHAAESETPTETNKNSSDPRRTAHESTVPAAPVEKAKRSRGASKCMATCI